MRGRERAREREREAAVRAREAASQEHHITAQSAHWMDVNRMKRIKKLCTCFSLAWFRCTCKQAQLLLLPLLRVRFICKYISLRVAVFFFFFIFFLSFRSSFFPFFNYIKCTSAHSLYAHDVERKMLKTQRYENTAVKKKSTRRQWKEIGIQIYINERKEKKKKTCVAQGKDGVACLRWICCWRRHKNARCVNHNRGALCQRNIDFRRRTNARNYLLFHLVEWKIHWWRDDGAWTRVPWNYEL